MRRGCEMRALRRYLGALLVGLLLVPFVCVGLPAGSVNAGGVTLGLPGRLAQVMAAANVSEEKAASLFAENMRALGVHVLDVAAGARGQGAVVAVVDTGVDPSHPALAAGPSRAAKIIDWIDLSGEGLVDTRAVAQEKKGALATEYGQVKLGSVRSVSGRYRYGVFRENQIARSSPLMTRFAAGGGDGWFLVVVVDSRKAGVYDTVVVDSNGNMDLSDDVPLRKFADGGGFASFSKPGTRVGAARLAFVVSDIAADGSKVWLGFDANGHGTMVAGIIAGSRAGYEGVAPAAGIIVIKVMDSAGNGSTERVMKAVRIAAAKGAGVVNLSVAETGEVVFGPEPGEESLPQLAEAGEELETLVVAAVGNGGPGIGSARLPEMDNRGVFVAAGYTPDLLQAYGVGSVEKAGIFSFSAVGPSVENGQIPSLVAPGIAAAPAPLWLSPSGYAVAQGTSIAAAHVSGLALVVSGYARSRGKQLSPVDLRGALLRGARPLEGYLPVEQGYGFADASGAVEAAKATAGQAEEIRVLTVSGNPPSYSYGGLFAVDVTPGLSIHAIDNFGAHNLTLKLESTQGWVRPEQDAVSIQAVREREVRLKYDAPVSEGLYSAMVVGRDQAGTPVTEIPVTYVRAAGFTPRANSVERLGEVEPGRWRRHYVRVPEGATSLKLALSVLQQDEPGASAMAYVISPDGQVNVTGLSRTEGNLVTVAQLQSDSPKPGVWEIVVYCPIPGPGTAAPSIVRYKLDAVCMGLLASPVVRTSEGLSRLVIQNSIGDLRAQAVVGVRRPDGYRGEELVREIGRGESLMYSLPEVKPGTVALMVETVPVGDGAVLSADLNLYVFRYDPVSREWTEVGQSARKGTSAELVRIAYPEPGEYVAYVEYVNGFSASRTVQFKLVTQRIDSDEALELAGVYGAALSDWKLGQEAVVDVAGSAQGAYLLVVEKDVPHEVIAVLPVSGAAGAEAVAWSVSSTPLLIGQRGHVVLRLWDRQKMTPLRCGVVLGSLYYPVLDGTLTLEVVPRSEEEILEGYLECEAGRMPFSIKLYAVKPDWGLVPLPRGFSGSPYVLRKVLSQAEELAHR
ncbi:MAG: S8 family peptidase [Bacillota bacterium]